MVRVGAVYGHLWGREKRDRPPGLSRTACCGKILVAKRQPSSASPWPRLDSYYPHEALFLPWIISYVCLAHKLTVSAPARNRPTTLPPSCRTRGMCVGDLGRFPAQAIPEAGQGLLLGRHRHFDGLRALLPERFLQRLGQATAPIAPPSLGRDVQHRNLAGSWCASAPNLRRPSTP